MSSTVMDKGRVALVTGAANGIGRAIAQRLAKDGFAIALNDIPSQLVSLQSLQSEFAAETRTVIVTADVSNDEEVRTMVERVVAELGSLDVMVANAGIYTSGTFIETSVEEWERCFSINSRGTFLCYKYAAKQMLAQGRGGRIIGASSCAGKRGAAYLAAYCSTKFAIRGLTQSVAQELGVHGITVNAYAPGAIVTPMLDQVAGAASKRRGVTVEDIHKMFGDESAAKRMGTSEEVAALIAFLVRDDARFINGQTISCDGGMEFS